MAVQYTHDSRLVTQSDLSGLHDQGQTGVDAVRGLLALLWCHLEASGMLDCREMCLVLVFLKRLCSPAVLDVEEDLWCGSEFRSWDGLCSQAARAALRVGYQVLAEVMVHLGMWRRCGLNSGTRTTSAD